MFNYLEYNIILKNHFNLKLLIKIILYEKDTHEHTKRQILTLHSGSNELMATL
jgi:hypothetical protein